MSERTSSPSGQKSRAQDLLGIALCMIGGFSAVSIFLAMQGQESENLLTSPVEGLMALVGAPTALVFGAALSALGVFLFLRPEHLAAGRHLLGLTGIGCGLSILIGGISASSGGLVGGALPGALGGLGGLAAGLFLGLTVVVASAWIAWPDLARGLAPKPMRDGPVGLPTLTPDAGGVTAAEAQALQPEPLPPRLAASSTPTRPRADVRVGGGVPDGTEPLPSFDALPGTRAPQGALEAERDDAPSEPDPALPHQSPDPDLVARGDDARALGSLDLGRFEEPAEASVLGASEPSSDGTDALPVPPAWEQDEAHAQAVAPADDVSKRNGDVEPLAAEIPDPLELSASSALVEGVPDTTTGTTGVAALEAGASPGASWEQVGLFDEEPASESEAATEAEEDEDEPEDVYEEAAELEDEEDDEEEEEEEELDEAAEYEEEEEEDEEEYEEEEDDDDEELEEAAELEEGEEEDEDEEEYEEEDEEEEEEEYVLTPPRDEESAAGAPETSPALVGIGGENLLLEAGNLILEENRVAVSMLQRRFSLDFDQACTLLDQLQEIGLIGPYVGGRTREVLLDAQAWKALAPETAST